jgi:hypothetical protein
MKILIDKTAGWITRFPEAIQSAENGAAIHVTTQDLLALGERAAVRMGREDLTFELEEPSDD